MRASSQVGAFVRRTGTSRCRFSSRSEDGPRWRSTYTRRSFRGFTVADNMSLEPSDLTPFSIVAPLDSRLPGGGGHIVQGSTTSFLTRRGGSTTSSSMRRRTDGGPSTSMASMSPSHARVGESFTFVGGTSTGQTVADNCDVRGTPARARHHNDRDECVRRRPDGFGRDAAEPVLSRRIRRAHAGSRPLLVHRSQDSTSSWRRRSRASPARYWLRTTRPPTRSWRHRWEGIFRETHPTSPSTWSRQVRCTAIASTSSISGSRKSSGTAALEPAVGVDIYNVLNSNAVLAYDNTFVPGGPWLQPLTVLTPRLFKITAALDW